jgi:hypothetical protein
MMKRIHIQTAIFVLSALILNGCSNLFLESPNSSGGENLVTDIPGGFGAIGVSFSRGAARTVMPEIDLAGLYLEYLFVKDMEAAEEKTPMDDKFILEPGSYTLTVKVFADAGKTLLAAEGTSASFTITAGVDAGTVGVTLHPVVSGEGTGSLEFGLQYPVGTTVVTLTLTRIAGEEGPVDLMVPPPSVTGSPPTLSGSRSNIPVGYYMLRARLRNIAGDFAGKSEVVHIYQNLIAKTVLAEYTFTEEDFNASLVTNANDAGPGSLRQAITDANAQTGQTIRLKLEPGAVIELQSPLPAITVGVTIEGNGVTLTPAASWTSGSASHLLYINSSSVAVTVRRLHFKNGLVQNYGGAIRNLGNLTLESCIFSGNRTTSSGAVGGAISSSNILTIRGCTFYGNTGYRGGAVDFSGTTLTLTGNLFYGNTGTNDYPVLYSTGAALSASYNVVDIASGTGGTECGWTYDGTDLQETGGLPVSPKTYRVLDGSAAAAVLPSTLPENYPAVDFYGQPVGGGGPAGAVQTLTANGIGYSWLDLSVNNPLAGNISANPAPDEDGLVPNGSVVFTAIPFGADSTFEQWLVDGIPDSETTNTLTLAISAHTRIHAVFSRVVTVNSLNDSGGGTLREALANAMDGDIITLSGVTPSTTVIELASPLPEITKNITIEGNGITLTPAASWVVSNTSHLLSITSSSTAVTVRRVHFRDCLVRSQSIWETFTYGGAIRNSGNLTLESCIFSGNQVVNSNSYDRAFGGAVYSDNTLTIWGCTFYGNKSNHFGGAVFFDASGKTLTLTGNLFYGNTASSYPVVRPAGTVSSSYNVVDIASGTGNAWCGWDYDSTDIQATSIPVLLRTFKVLYGRAAMAMLPASLPADYPATDFYGQAISGGGAAGAVQAITASTYSWLELSVNNSQRGSVSVSPAPDEDGLVPNGSITITANPNSGIYPFTYWLVDGVQETANPHTLTISAHTSIQAVFSRLVTVDSANDSGSGTLREALSNTEDNDIITLSGVTPGVTMIELASSLPEVTKNITIEGNGVILTPAASWAGSSTSRLFHINSSSAMVTIRRVHFKNGLVKYVSPYYTTTISGGAIWNNGNLTLESCIFSGNRIEATSPSAFGGAIYSENNLTIRGCTFYGNTAKSGGGAVHFAGSTLTLTGNLFYGNAPVSNYPVLYFTGTTLNPSYNVVDIASGTGTAGCGWDYDTTDVQETALPILPRTFKVLYGRAAADALPASLPADYPVVDFYGDSISGGGTAGAVQTVMAGYSYLDLSVNNTMAGSISVNPGPDEDNLTPNDTSITLTANQNPGAYSFAYWLVDGVKEAANPHTLTISAHTSIQAVFGLWVDTFTDTTGSDTTPGTLRYALANAVDGDTIYLSGVSAGSTAIMLERALPAITKSLTIDGNGITLTRASWIDSADTFQLLPISGGVVTIRQVHFKNGLGAGDGGAIGNSGILTLESCVFSGNRTSGNGGAISSINTLTIRGCTFYGNTARNNIGVVYFNSWNRTLTLTGNLFYGNTGGNRPVAYISNGTVSSSYNMVDAAFGTGSGQCGWVQGTEDQQIAALPISPKTFRLYGTGAANVLTALPDPYPVTDFYGHPISAGGAAGAVQASTQHETGYYYLDVSVNHNHRGSVDVSPLADDDGLYASGTVVTLTQNPSSSAYLFAYWRIAGTTTYTSSPSFTLTDHAQVQAVFGRDITVDDFTDITGSETTQGTLRYALTNAEDDDIISFIGVIAGTTTIALRDTVSIGFWNEIRTNLIINGNGVTLTRASSWTNSDDISQLLRFSNGMVMIRGVHFKDGLAHNEGGAIFSSGGTLTLESCIFSGNQTTGDIFTTRGGAIYAVSNLTIRGCTFYGNAAHGYGIGGAVYGNPLTLTGNLFYGNTTDATGAYPVVYVSGGTVSASHNVVDVAYGTGSTQSGWAAGTGDKTTLADSDDLTITGAPFNTTTFAPVGGLQNILPSTRPTDFPETDFYGAARTFPGAPGAVK